MIQVYIYHQRGEKDYLIHDEYYGVCFPCHYLHENSLIRKLLFIHLFLHLLDNVIFSKTDNCSFKRISRTGINHGLKIALRDSLAGSPRRIEDRDHVLAKWLFDINHWLTLETVEKMPNALAALVCFQYGLRWFKTNVVVLWKIKSEFFSLLFGKKNLMQQS